MYSLSIALAIVASYSLLFCGAAHVASVALETEILRKISLHSHHESEERPVNAVQLRKDLKVEFTENKVIESGSVRRTYHLIGPAEDDDSQTALRPAILMFHGFGGDAAVFSIESRMPAEAKKRGYVLAYLDGSSKVDSPVPSQERMWNSGAAGGRAARQDVDDVGFAVDVINELVTNQRVDPKRVFAAGLSNGGSMAVRLACEKSDLLAGAMAAHGSLEFRKGDKCADDCEQSGYCQWNANRTDCQQADWVEQLPKIFECEGMKNKKLPLLLVNGEKAPGTTPSGSVYLPNSSTSESFPSVHFMAKYFVDLYGCGGHRTEGTPSSDSTDWTRCTSYSGCNLLQFCMSSAGDWWYGDDYDVPTACVYTGGQPSTCTRQSQFDYWGPNTNTLLLTERTLDFFDNVTLASV